MIQISKVRIENFRSLKIVEVRLSPITLLVGSNNAGKTSFLKALDIAFGNDKKFVGKEDLHIDAQGIYPSEPIIRIDLFIIPEKEDLAFSEEASHFFGEQIQENAVGQQFIAFRTQIDFSKHQDSAQIERFLITDWNSTKADEGQNFTGRRDLFPFFYMDAQRDLLEELRMRSSYFGKLVEQLTDELDGVAIKEIEEKINELNLSTVEKSEVLKHLQGNLAILNQTLFSKESGIEISPFPKKVRDLHKGLSVHFKDTSSEAFSLEYHGMGTRSWASLLTFKAYIEWEEKYYTNENLPYFPVLALEEPEAHLHPNAQRQVYAQMRDMIGQKIISTHSPYIAAQAELSEIRHFRKNTESGVTEIRIIDINDSIIQQKKKELELLDYTLKGVRKTVAELEATIKTLKDEAREAKRKIKADILNSKGEILFANAVVLFEGITESQAIAIHAHTRFRKNAFEMGILLLPVGSNTAYKPYLQFLCSLDIPTFIFSDSDKDSENLVKEQIKTAGFEEGFLETNGVFLSNNWAYEDYILENYSAILREAIIKYETDNSPHPQFVAAKRKEWEEAKVEKIKEFVKSDKNKAKIAPIYSQLIADKNEVPPKEAELFTKIQTILHI